MFSFFDYILTIVDNMWLKICYVLKNNKDKLLGYIHIPTNQEKFNEEIRWVQARHGRKKERIRCVTPDLDADECCSPKGGGSPSEDFKYEDGESMTFQAIDDSPEQDGDFNELPSPTEKDDEDGDVPGKDFSVEIRYQPREEYEGSDDVRTPSPLDSSKEGETCGREDPEDETSCAHLEQVSFNNKIRFIYSHREEGDEILSIPARQDEFNRGICNLISSPKKGKSLNKSTSSHRKLTPSRNDDTFTVPGSSADLKEYVYHQWLQRKKLQTKQEFKENMLARKKAQQEADAEASERKTNVKKTFDAWNDSKSEGLLSDKERKQKAKQTEKEKLEETLQRKKDAEKYFETWKKEKDEQLKKLYSQKKKEERDKDKETFNYKRQTSEEALKAFDSWKQQKGKESSEKKKREAEEKAKVGEEKVLAFEKKQEALRVYEEWKNNTKRSLRQGSPPLTQSSWLPAGRNLNNTIPEKVQPVIIRRRNVSR